MVRSSSHQIEVQGEGSAQAEVALAEKAGANNRDFILDYRLAGDKTATGLTLYKDDRAGGVLLAQPGV